MGQVGESHALFFAWCQHRDNSSMDSNSNMWREENIVSFCKWYCLLSPDNVYWPSCWHLWPVNLPAPRTEQVLQTESNREWVHSLQRVRALSGTSKNIPCQVLAVSFPAMGMRPARYYCSSLIPWKGYAPCQVLAGSLLINSIFLFRY